MKENAKLHIVVIENGDLKKMVANLEDELHECKKASLKKRASTITLSYIKH